MPMHPSDVPAEIAELDETCPYWLPPSGVRVIIAHFWPAIEQHIREQVAQEIDAAADRTVAEYPDNPAMSARVIGQRAAARIARGTDTTRSTR